MISAVQDIKMPQFCGCGTWRLLDVLVRTRTPSGGVQWYCAFRTVLPWKVVSKYSASYILSYSDCIYACIIVAKTIFLLEFPH